MQMRAQTQIEFTTSSPINIEKLSGQNRRLYDWLVSGNKIHCMDDAMRNLQIGYLNSRISDLTNKYKIPVKSEFIEVESFGKKTTVKLYSL